MLGFLWMESGQGGGGSVKEVIVLVQMSAHCSHLNQNLHHGRKVHRNSVRNCSFSRESSVPLTYS